MSSTTTASPATTDAATSTTAAPAPSTSTTTTTIPVAVDPVEPLPIPRLENGLPATFVGVTEDWEAVEVDTATGEVVRVIGSIEKPAEVEDEFGGRSVIQQVWRTSDHEWYVISDCCEPAAGMIHYLDRDTTLTEANHDETLISFGWTVAPSPFDGRLAGLGFSLEIFEVGAESVVSVGLDQSTEYPLPFGVAAWDRAGDAVWFVTGVSEINPPILLRVDLADPEAVPAALVLDWIAGGQWLDGVGTQESGNLVAFLQTPGDTESGVTATEGVVFSPDGELLATFPVESGSHWGGYEPSGRMLIYTDGAGNVRWQGRGESGILAEGFIHASW